MKTSNLLPKITNPEEESKQSVKENTDKSVAGPPYHNPGPLV